MKQTVNSAVQEKLKNLSVLPPGIAKLLKVFSDEDISRLELVAALEQYPSIIARLIALANSAWSAPVSPVVTLEIACSRLGFNVVRSVSIALAISTPFDPNRCKSFEADRFLCSSMLTAEAAGFMAKLVGEVEPQIARTAGLLHNLGLLLLVDSLPHETDCALKKVQQDPALSVNMALKEKCGIGYDEAGAMLGEAMELPRSLVEVMACHRSDMRTDEYHSLIGIIGIAREMVSTCYRQEIYSSDNGLRRGDEHVSSQLEEVFAKMSENFSRTQQMASTLINV